MSHFGQKINILVLFYAFSCGNIFAQTVVLGTKLGNTVAGVEIGAHQLAIYDMQTEDVRIIISANEGENFDAASFLPNGNIIFSSRGTITVAEKQFYSKMLGEYDWLTETSTYFLTSSIHDVAAVHIIDESNYLIAFKVPNQFGGLDYSVGDIFLYDSQSEIATLFFSHEKFFIVEEGGTYAVGNIDAVAMTTDGNLLLSTTNTAQIGTNAQNAVKLFQAGVYEYNLTSGEVTEFFDPALFATSADLKAFSLAPSPPPDADGDGVANYFDQCQSTPGGLAVDLTGCAFSVPAMHFIAYVTLFIALTFTGAHIRLKGTAKLTFPRGIISNIVW